MVSVLGVLRTDSAAEGAKVSVFLHLMEVGLAIARGPSQLSQHRGAWTGTVARAKNGPISESQFCPHPAAPVFSPDFKFCSVLTAEQVQRSSDYYSLLKYE